MKNKSAKLVCNQCSKTENIMSLKWQCDCGSFFNIDHNYSFNPKTLEGSYLKMWRFKDAIPLFDQEAVVSMGEGGTPLTSIDWNGLQIYIKLEMLFPTGSYKDRGASVIVTRAAQMGVSKIVEDSSGNAGCAVAAYCAAAGIPCDIYVSSTTLKAKLQQIQSYNAELKLIKGTREDVAKAAFEAAKKPDVYYASHVWDPYFLQGTKTFAFEVWEQLEGNAPDTIVIPTGNGTLLLGTYLGFYELKQMGLIAKIPRLIAVQADRCAPVYSKFTMKKQKNQWTNTIADAIAIAKPLRIDQIIDCIKKSGGDVIAVDEQAILDAKNWAGAKGIFIEPTSAVALAALADIEIKPNETVVIPLTGHGLKSVSF